MIELLFALTTVLWVANWLLRNEHERRLMAQLNAMRSREVALQESGDGIADAVRRLALRGGASSFLPVSTQEMVHFVTPMLEMSKAPNEELVLMAARGRVMCARMSEDVVTILSSRGVDARVADGLIGSATKELNSGACYEIVRYLDENNREIRK